MKNQVADLPQLHDFKRLDPENIKEFQQRIPHAQVVDVSGAGHMVAGDRNDIFLDAVLEFLRDCV